MLINKRVIRQAVIQDLPIIVPILDAYSEHFKQEKNLAVIADNGVGNQLFIRPPRSQFQRIALR
jgi:hypothetical protein